MEDAEKNAVLDEQQEVLGTIVRILVRIDSRSSENYEEAKKSVAAAFFECNRLDLEYSRFRKNNRLTHINSVLHSWQKIDSELFYLLKEAKNISRKTNGAFDLGVKTILENWGYDAEYSFKSTKEIDNSFPKTSYELQPPHKVKLFRPIELGGLGKGYALDLMAKKLSGFTNFFIDAGGDLYAQGCPEKGKTWHVLFEHPTDLSQAIGQVEVNGFFLAASNTLKRRWAKYHHLVDTKSHSPANNMLAVYTQAKTGLLADAYSTALFVLGFEEAKKLLPAIPIDAMLISPKGEIFKTPHFKGQLFQKENPH